MICSKVRFSERAVKLRISLAPCHCTLSPFFVGVSVAATQTVLPPRSTSRVLPKARLQIDHLARSLASRDWSS